LALTRAALRQGVIADDFGVALPRYIQSILNKKIPTYKGDLSVLETEHDEDGDIFILSVVRPGPLGVACASRPRPQDHDSTLSSSPTPVRVVLSYSAA
jgi:hypothetical protein